MRRCRVSDMYTVHVGICFLQQGCEGVENQKPQHRVSPQGHDAIGDLAFRVTPEAARDAGSGELVETPAEAGCPTSDAPSSRHHAMTASKYHECSSQNWLKDRAVALEAIFDGSREASSTLEVVKCLASWPPGIYSQSFLGVDVDTCSQQGQNSIESTACHSEL